MKAPMTSERAPDERKGSAGLAGRIGSLLGLYLGRLYLGKHGIDPCGSVRWRQAGAGRDQLAEISLVIG